MDGMQTPAAPRRRRAQGLPADPLTQAAPPAASAPVQPRPRRRSADKAQTVEAKPVSAAPEARPAGPAKVSAPKAPAKGNETPAARKSKTPAAAKHHNADQGKNSAAGTEKNEAPAARPAPPVARGNAATRGHFRTGQNPPYMAGMTPSGAYPPMQEQASPVIQGYPPQDPRVLQGYAPLHVSQENAPQSYVAPVQPVSQEYPPQGPVYAAPVQGYPPQPGYPPAYGSQSVPMPVRQAGDSSTRGYTPPRKPEPEPEKPNAALAVLRWLLLLAVIAGLGYGGYKGVTTYLHQRSVAKAVEPYNAVYCENVFVDGIDLSGMTQEQARAVVTSQAEARVNGWSVILSFEGVPQRIIRTSDLGMTVHVDDALREAWNRGHTGDNEQRLAEMNDLKGTPFEAYTATPGTDTSAIDSILDQLADELYIAPQDASIAAFLPYNTYPFAFNEEIVGRRLDVEPLKERLYRMLSAMEGGEVELEPVILEPAVTVASLKENQVALRGSWATDISSKSDENRNSNIRRAFELISGTVLHPGELFSFNKIVGQRTESNGFYPAPEYVYEEVQTGVGGGVCQASSTIYVAAVRAGLEIVKREPHSMAVNYTVFGKDATVYWYSNHKIDLVFRNTTNSDLYITASVQSADRKRSSLQCKVNIYGEGLGGVTYDIVTETTVIPAPIEPEIIKDRKGEFVTYTDEEYEIRKASDGYSVDSYCVTYNSKGQELERRKLYTDVYQPKARQVYVGVKTRETQ